jgi:replicative DNA helicase
MTSYNHISKGVKLTKDFLKARKSGEAKSLLTAIPKLNDLLMNGLDWNRILTIAGLSGSGKSMILENFKRDFVALNKDQDFCILSFEFEMLIEDQLARNISSKMEKEVKELYSAKGELSDEDLDKACDLLDDYAKAPVYYVDNLMTVAEINTTILDFASQHIKPFKDRGLIVTLDHTLLTKGKTGDNEKTKVDELMHSLVALKKYLASEGIKVVFIVLAQLNRDIESTERIINRNLHYPTKNDIFAASSVYYSSDYVLITHKPADISGIGEFYGPPQEGFPKGLPLKSPKNPERDMIYWHLIKERFGVRKVILMEEDFKNSRICQY